MGVKVVAGQAAKSFPPQSIASLASYKCSFSFVTCQLCPLTFGRQILSASLSFGTHFHLLPDLAQTRPASDEFWAPTSEQPLAKTLDEEPTLTC